MEPLTASEQATLDIVVNLIVPPSADGRLPGAAEYDVWSHVLGFRPELAPGIRAELAEANAFAEDEHGQPLAALPPDVAAAAIAALREARPKIFASLARQTVTCYYQQDQVLEAIGMPARPPFPLGFEVPRGDLSLLDPVKARGKMYRDA